MGLGIVSGLVLSFALNQVIARWIENAGHDPLIVMAVSGILIAVAALACWMPARRALGIDPMVALRCD